MRFTLIHCNEFPALHGRTVAPMPTKKTEMTIVRTGRIVVGVSSSGYIYCGNSANRSYITGRYGQEVILAIGKALVKVGKLSKSEFADGEKALKHSRKIWDERENTLYHLEALEKNGVSLSPAQLKLKAKIEQEIDDHRTKYPDCYA